MSLPFTPAKLTPKVPPVPNFGSNLYFVVASMSLASSFCLYLASNHSSATFLSRKSSSMKVPP